MELCITMDVYPRTVKLYKFARITEERWMEDGKKGLIRVCFQITNKPHGFRGYTTDTKTMFRKAT